MIILGLDVSSSCTGVCVIEDGYLKKESLQTIEPSSKLTIGKKLCFFENRLKEIIETIKPDAIVIEDIFKGRNIKTFRVLAMFRGVCFKIVSQLTQKDPECIMPSESRKLVGITGITKEDAFEYIIKKHKLKKFNFNQHNDICDAIVLAFAYWNKLNNKNIIRKSNKRKKKK